MTFDYRLDGDGIHLTLRTEGSDVFGIVDIFEYRDASLSTTFRGNEIRIVETEMARLASVTLKNHPDLVRFALLIPKISVGASISNIAVSTIGITTTSRSSASKPPNGEQIDFYAVHSLSGSASLSVIV